MVLTGATGPAPTGGYSRGGGFDGPHNAGPNKVVPFHRASDLHAEEQSEPNNEQSGASFTETGLTEAAHEGTHSDPSFPIFDHAIALEFYNAVKPSAFVLGYTQGRQVVNGELFQMLARVADDKHEHLFFHVATVKPTWAGVTTATKNEILESDCLWGDCDAEKYVGNDTAAATLHYKSEGLRIKAVIDESLSKLGLTPFACWRSGAGWQLLIKLDCAIAPDEAEELVGKLHIALGFDPIVRNCNRILRVPGSVNWKSRKDGRAPSPCTPLFLTGVVTNVDQVREALADVPLLKKECSTCAERESKIDWTYVNEPGWLKSVDDLPADAPAKLRQIVAHDGTLKQLNEELIEANLLQKPYRSWSDVTFALAALLARTQKYTREQIAEALLAPLHCNQHIGRQENKERAIERAINRSHALEPETRQGLAEDAVLFTPGNEENCRRRLTQVVAADPQTYCLGRPTGPLMILRVPENRELPEGTAWGATFRARRWRRRRISCYALNA